ncbi:MAG: TonB-dependent receptor [Saprospiraceae bacterium]|nr:TonB-dependent receptor [Saprospiraceae bacterium]
MRKRCLAGMALCFVFQNLISQTDTTGQIPELTIRENRLEIPFSQQSRTIQVLNRQQLDAMPVHTVAEALQQLAGVDVRQRGPFGVQADIHVRGGSFDQVLVLINGVRLSDPQTGHHVMNLPVDWSAIERIEVLKGPGARIYGQNAFACAVNIVTKSPGKPALEIGVSAGDFGYFQGQLYAAAATGGVTHQLSASTDVSDGYRYNTDFNIWKGWYQAQWTDGGGGDWRLGAGIVDQKFGANGFYGRLEFTDQYEEVQTNVVSLDYRKQVNNWLFKPRVYWRRNQDEWVFRREDPGFFRNFHLSQVGGVDLNGVWKNSLGETGLGVSAEYTALFSSNLGDRERMTYNVFAEHRFSFLYNHLDVVPGVAVSHFTDFGTFVYPGIDAGLRLNNQWKIIANAGYNTRIPTFTDLYYEDAGNVGNPNLEPEKALSLESGVQYNHRGLNLQAAVFSRAGTNLIDWAKDNEADKWQVRNFNDLAMRGIDVSANWYVPAMTGKQNGLQRLTLGYCYLDADVNTDVAYSRYTLNHLQHQITASADARWKWLSGNVRARWADRVTTNTETKDDYFVVDAGLKANTGRFTVFAEATNLFDVTYGDIRYSETAVLTMPGRWFRAGLRYVFVGK